jgi:inosine-uridine nucleoside N-ribohydrolase
MTKVLLDTDIGSDIDDAVCLAYLLAQPECELLGITTVTGQAVRRARMASALCAVAGRDVPIFPGADCPLLIGQKQTEVPQAAALDRWEHRADFPTGEAVEFLRSTIRSHPCEVVLLTIGPLTNAALLFAVDPEIPALLKGLVMMCGVFGGPPEGRGPLEWNARGDPHATAVVYRARPPVHRSVGLDVTVHCRMDADAVRRRFGHERLRPVLDFAEVWFEGGRNVITFHDPLAAATVFEPGLCAFESGAVEVELDDPDLRGRTVWSGGGAEAPHEVAFDVDPDRFFEHYFSVFD